MQDLSARTEGFPGFGSSMQAGNTISKDAVGKLPSTSSEATDGVPLGNPDLDIPAAYDAPNHIGTTKDSSDLWTTVQGVTDDGR